MWKKPAALCAVSALVCCGEMARELHTFRVRRYSLKLPGKEEGRSVRFVFLSDLHGKEYGRDHCRLLKQIRTERPDCILVGGDMLTRTDPDTDGTALRLLSQLPDIAPVYAANGNHEQKMKADAGSYRDRYRIYKEKLEEAGVMVLENETRIFEKGTFRAAVSGLELPLECYGHFRTEKLSSADKRQIGHLAGREEFSILLAHNPAYMEDYWKAGADLVLSGHLHGGILRLPVLGGVITPQMQLFPEYSGDLYKKKGHYCIVSRGLGTHTVNVRLFNMAELVSLEIRS